MAIQVASLEAVLDLDKKSFEKDLKATDKSLDKAKDGLKDFAGQAAKLGAGLTKATNKGRLGLSSIDQSAQNAKGSLSSMLGTLGGGAAAAAESSLNNVGDNVNKLGKSADTTRAKFGSMGNTLTSRMGKAGKSVKDFGKDSSKAMSNFIDDMRKATDEVDDLGDAGADAGKKFGGLADGLGDLIPGLDQLKGLASGGGPLTLLAGGALAVGAAIFDAGSDVQDTFNMIEARTGATGKKLEVLGRTAQTVFVSGFGDSLEGAADAVIQVNQVLGQTGDVALDSAKKALTMRDVFGIVIPESLRAVRSANKQFGDETGDTFDMMATVIQRVGDPYQDLADTVNEYSADLAQAGFTQAEFFGILEAGVSLGARNFDILADLVREFTIRIIDGSDKTKNALNSLFEATGQGSQEMASLKRELGETETALGENEAALKSSEGAFRAQADIVDDLEDALSSAQRKLDELSRPNLQGMEEFDDKLFDLDQGAKRLQLALLDLQEDTPAFENTKKQLEEVNKEMDRVALERDLTIGAQLREIEKAAQAGIEPIVSYEQALAAVAAQKGKIDELEGSLGKQTEALIPLANEYERLTDENKTLIEQQDELKEKLGELITPADEFLQKLASGEMTTRDAMSAIIDMLGDVENQVIADQLAVDLFGTKAEELGLDIVLALDPAVNKMIEFEGATDRAAAAMEQGLRPAIERYWRLAKVAFGEGAKTIISGDVGKVVEDAKRAINLGVKTIFGGDSAGAEAVPELSGGGIIPGPIGQAVPIIGHGGENVQTVEQQAAASGGITVIIQGSIFGEDHLQQIVMQTFGQLQTALVSGGNR